MCKIQMKDFIIVYFVCFLVLKLFKYKENGDSVFILIDSTPLLL